MDTTDFNGMQAQQMVLYDTPQVVDFWVSGTCNLRCKYCVHSLPPEAEARKDVIPTQISWEDFLRVARDLQRFPRQVAFAGFCGIGEPLTHPLLPKMVAYLKQNRIVSVVQLVTNGLLLNREISQSLIDAGLDVLSVSIQGVDSEAYRSLCGVAKDPREIAENLRWFMDHKGSQTRVLARTLDIALPNKSDEVRFHEIFDPVADQTIVTHAVRLYQNMDYTELIPEPVDQYRGGEVVSAPCCPLVFYTLHIRPNGTIAPCPLPVCPLDLGNIRDVSLQEAWNSEERLRLLLDHAESARERRAACAECVQPDMLCRDKRPPKDLPTLIRARIGALRLRGWR